MTKTVQWQGRWACIGGGSSGLGLVLARQLIRLGANVAIVGRDPVKLAQATTGLNRLSHELGTTGLITSFSLDLAASRSELEVSSPQEWERWNEWLRVTSLDLAIAAAGKSDRGFLMQISISDLQKILDANVFTSLAFSQYCEEALTRGRGTLIHISSLAGIVAAPGMGAYSMAKHAVVAMSRQMRLELAGKGIRVMLVCPGPIANLDLAGRYDDLVTHRNLPENLKLPAGGSKVRSVEAEWIADEILKAAKNGTKEMVVPAKVKWLAALGGLFPSFSDFMLKAKQLN